MSDRVSRYPASTFASTALLFFGSGLAATLLLSAKPLESLIGVTVACIGLSIMLGRVKRRNLAMQLMSQGHAIQATVTDVRDDGLFQVSGHAPYRIVAQWVDPRSGEVRTFHSWKVLSDPRVFIRDEHVVVYIDPERSQRYYLDISFLPDFDEA
ncbi:MAG TPA: hypothetical protein VIT62_13070 [Lysobacter sp.]